MRIKNLICHVTVKPSGARTRRGGNVRPTMEFAVEAPMAEVRAAESAEPAKQAEAAGENAAVVAPSKTDPAAVADRVYQLMVDEARVGRQRHGRF